MVNIAEQYAKKEWVKIGLNVWVQKNVNSSTLIYTSAINWYFTIQ